MQGLAMNVFTTLLLCAVACVVLLEAKKAPLGSEAPTSLESASFSSSQDKSDLEQDHRNLQLCSEDDVFFVITSCENVCGVSGLTFAAELAAQQLARACQRQRGRRRRSSDPWLSQREWELLLLLW